MWMESARRPSSPPSAPAEQRRLHKNTPAALPIYDEAYRFYGVDLSAVPGVSAGVLCVLMSEVGIGSQMQKAFRSAEAFSPWMGLCPDNRVSGGKVLKAKTSRASIASRRAVLDLSSWRGGSPLMRIALDLRPCCASPHI